MGRTEKLCALLDRCSYFADIACDHGYIAEYMLDNGLCDRAVVSDISAKSLAKAENLLKSYIQSGRCRAVCCDGLTEIDKDIDTAVIAGIGGDEITDILESAFIPENFLFQPMKNCRRLRAFLLGRGCRLVDDNLFYDRGRYYFYIKGSRTGGTVGYSQAELEFGRDSLKNPLFYDYLREEIDKKSTYAVQDMNEEHKKEYESSLEFMREVCNGYKGST